MSYDVCRSLTVHDQQTDLNLYNHSLHKLQVDLLKPAK